MYSLFLLCFVDHIVLIVLQNGGTWRGPWSYRWEDVRRLAILIPMIYFVIVSSSYTSVELNSLLFYLLLINFINFRCEQRGCVVHRVVGRVACLHGRLLLLSTQVSLFSPPNSLSRQGNGYISYGKAIIESLIVVWTSSVSGPVPFPPFIRPSRTKYASFVRCTSVWTPLSRMRTESEYVFSQYSSSKNTSLMKQTDAYLK